MAALDGILFQPYLRGERTPHNDVSARAAFAGLDATSDSVDLARAVLEGVAFSLRMAQDLLTDGAQAHSSLCLVGGGAKSALWSRIIATVLGRPIAVVQDAGCVPALGAARLAMVASGEADLEAVAFAPALAYTAEPTFGEGAAWDQRFQAFRKLYPALKPITGELLHPAARA